MTEEQATQLNWGNLTLSLPYESDKTPSILEGFQPIRVESVTIPTEAVVEKMLPIMLIFFAIVILLFSVKGFSK